LAAEIRARRGPMRAAPKHILLDYTFVRRQSDAAPRRRPSARAWRRNRSPSLRYDYGPI